ncbi:2-iminobutanoate/2-iminopropanoate deaminase [Streptomyces sp. SAI-135]|uniref:RidA family protein n=1 Tax=unclassified Streptomyces TaxID=2593676 RepID=UPI002473FD87|nr:MULTISPECIES: RidA family protein [unclassified Streptomyces]MDH6522811.1 2-iminobutanoate/2-iminopropanoate deaminase [Streptomyces sp. SAI-090]MDH6554432.1 2-iminobutanoate/2-iminopropanoate deaminase [Streptomyces sp. SAI-041]MDH6573698.1 2-iminobutanoate/2-iminopropanoate deaminase [Streptomyces sp. SAI-117]MDH6613574.1 2-iminobutanoate/2-iminopropanoate deaminase [Streptomyces sp. SAI-135]
MIKEIATDNIAPLEVPLTHVVRAGDYVYLSGQIAVRADGSLVTNDFPAETRAVLDNIKAGVEAAGGTLADVCKTTVFLLNATLFEPMNVVYREYFSKPFPARSTIVAPLSNPDLRIEIEAVAYIPQNG